MTNREDEIAELKERIKTLEGELRALRSEDSQIEEKTDLVTGKHTPKLAPSRARSKTKKPSIPAKAAEMA